MKLIALITDRKGMRQIANRRPTFRQCELAKQLFLFQSFLNRLIGPNAEDILLLNSYYYDWLLN